VIIIRLRQLQDEAEVTDVQFIAMGNAIDGAWKAASTALRIRFQAMPHGVSLVW